MNARADDLTVRLRAILGMLPEATALHLSAQLDGVRRGPRLRAETRTGDGHTVRLRTILGTLPGATSIGVHAFEAWALVLITASSDEMLIALSKELGLEASKLGSGRGRWWRRAIWDSSRGSLRVVVVGPHHTDPPPHDPPSAFTADSSAPTTPGASSST